ncbi:hypothetical protein FEM03_06480 [Phragmitibacter flavus]|uniref:Alpha/beta hydrolase n=1 Tax=Phragmitibacter flavus TaxID=2576071 RepID=A0A5R8KHR6_9BACT|nr:hypothetical protein [Phragmitibacter flavus]TLD71780.1 hypothetical protein FEM03_06480 [Phragmitibacter flavus]
MKVPTIIFAGLVLAASFEVRAQSPEWDAGPKPNPHLDVATFRWWSPPETKTLRGVLVIIPGRNGDARNSVADAEWQAFAARTGFALVGCQLQQDPGGKYQGDPDGSTAKVLNEAVNALAAANGHAYLKDPPLAFWGTSAGSNTAERYSQFHHKRVVAIASIKGTWGPGSWMREKADIPWLVCVGKTDKPDWVDTAVKYFEEGKSNRAAWTLALHPTEGHSTGNTKPLAIAFLQDVIALRLPASGGGLGFGSAARSGSGSGLQKMSLADGWLGDPETFETNAMGSFHGKKRDATWLPGEATAKAWVQYLKGS